MILKVTSNPIHSVILPFYEVHHPASVSVFQDYTEHLPQCWCRLFSVQSQHPPCCDEVVVNYCTKMTSSYSVVICTDATATVEIPEMPEGNERK